MMPIRGITVLRGQAVIDHQRSSEGTSKRACDIEGWVLLDALGMVRPVDDRPAIRCLRLR